MSSQTETLKHRQYAQDDAYGTPFKSRYSNSVSRRKREEAYTDTANSHENKLPVNLLYGAAEYKKMIITNGRSIKKNSEYITDNFVDTLEFINDPIFQSCQQKRESLKHKQKQARQQQSRNKTRSISKDYLCCCCDQFCKYCAGENKAKEVKKMGMPELEDVIDKIEKKAPLNVLKNKKKVINSQVHIRNSAKENKESEKSHPEYSSSYLSHKSFNLDTLITKTLRKFEQQKRQSKLKSLRERRQRQQKAEMFKKYAQHIREANLAKVMNPKQKSTQKKARSKSATKNEVRFEYWHKKRDLIAEEIQKYKKQGIEKYHQHQQLKKDQVNCKHKIRIGAQQRKMLAEHNGRMALEKMMKQKHENKKKRKIIQKRLRQLDRYRLKQVRSCSRRKFEPSPQMIQNAFKNLVQQKKQSPIPPKKKGKK